MKISLFVLTQLTNVTDTQTDGQTDGQTPHDSIGRAYASHRAAKNVQCKSCKFRFIRVFYVSISIQNILKGNLQPKCKGASVWQKSTAVITGLIFTCPGRAGPVFRLDRGLTYFARIALRAAQHAMEPLIYSLRITIYRWPYSRHFVKTNHVHSVGDNFA